MGRRLAENTISAHEIHVGPHIGEPVGRSVSVSRVRLPSTTRHNHFYNLETHADQSTKHLGVFGLSPARVKHYSNRQSAPQDTKQPGWSSRINEGSLSLTHNPEEAAKLMVPRTPAVDLSSQVEKGPIRTAGKGTTDAAIKFGNLTA